MSHTFLKALTVLSPSSLKELAGQVQVLIETKLWAKVLFGMFLGILLGIVLSPSGPFSSFVAKNSKEITSLTGWLVFPAQMFLKVIRMVIIPLILSSIIRGLASTEDVGQMKRLGGKFSLFVFMTSVLASMLGVLLTKIIGPGRGLNLVTSKAQQAQGELGDLFSFAPDTLLNVLPGNPLNSIVEGQMLDVVVISIIAGVAFLSIDKNQAKGMMDALEVIQKICMTIISWAMRLAPFAVFGMMTQVASTTGIKALQNMFFYVVTCFAGYLLFILFYVVLVSIIKRQAPLIFLKRASTPMLLAFSTSSSAATMPVTMKVAEEEMKINPSTARFLIPLGTTINMAGSSIWHTTAVVFLSQAYGIDLSIGQILLVASTSIASAIGSPGVPGVGIGILTAVLVKVGVPVEGVSLIMGVDRIVDMGCTVVNVLGDLTASQIFGKAEES